MPEQIGASAYLLQLKAVCWSGTKSLPESVVEEMTRQPNSTWLSFRGRKSLIEPGRLARIKNVISLARRHLKRHSLPFPIPSVYLLSREGVELVRPYLDEMKAGFGQMVDDFTEIYAEAIAEAERHLGGNFHLWDYPVEIKTKFSFEWRFLFLPGTVGGMVPEETREEEIRKFTDLMAEAKKLAMAGLRKQFAVIVSRLVKDFSADEKGRKKIVHNDAFDRLLNFFEEFRVKNIFQDDELSRLVTEAQAAISGLDEADDLSQAWLNRHLREQFTTLQEQLEEVIVDRPRRLIRPS